MQVWQMSLVEALTNITIGYAAAVATQVVVFPVFGISVPMSDNLAIGLVFTGVSLLRTYLLRRAFNRLAGKAVR